MLPKPGACQGCALYQDGLGFVPDELLDEQRGCAPGDPAILVMGQNPGAEEEREGRPFVGRTGQAMERHYFPLAGLHRGENVNLGNVLRCRWQHENALPPEAILKPALEHCARAHTRVPPGTRLIVAQGALAWRALGGPGKVTDWRGFLKPGGSPLPAAYRGGDEGTTWVSAPPLLATLHLADLFRDPKMRAPTMRDWAKIPLFLDGKWPTPAPPFDVCRSSAQLAAWLNAAHEFLVIDTEYHPVSRDLYLVGLGCPGMSRGLQLDALYLQSAPAAGDLLKRAVRRCRVVFQNAVADLPILERHLGVRYADYLQIDDTMLAHAALWAEWPHDLEFLASVYGVHEKRKHLAQTHPLAYNAGDVLDTISAWEGLRQELADDPLSARVYHEQSLPLIPLILESMARGIRVNKARVEPAQQEYTSILAHASEIALAYAGRAFGLGSSLQLQHQLYAVEGLPIQKAKGTKRASIDADAIAELRKRFEPYPDFEAEEREGLTIEQMLSRIEQGAHPLLEARVLYASAQQALSHYIKPALERERLYPEFHIHAQANGRWSTINPPLAQLPRALRDILIPDEGEVWLGWDWDQAELRIMAALAQDRPLLEAFRRGEDVHTLGACELFSLPYPLNRVDPHTASENLGWRSLTKWEGKEDARRVFAKRRRYKLMYGGEPTSDIPGAKALGLDKARLTQVNTADLAAHPALGRWRAQVRARVRGNHPHSRTFLGRLRRFLGSGRKVEREAFDHPMQGAVSDIFNITAIEVKRRCPWLRFVYGMHDSQWWACPEARVEETWPLVKGIVEQAWDVNGMALVIPASYHERRAA